MQPTRCTLYQYNVLVYRSSTGVQLNTMRSLRPLHTLPPGREIIKEIHVKYEVKSVAVITNNRVITT